MSARLIKMENAKYFLSGALRWIFRHCLTVHVRPPAELTYW